MIGEVADLLARYGHEYGARLKLQKQRATVKPGQVMGGRHAGAGSHCLGRPFSRLHVHHTDTGSPLFWDFDDGCVGVQTSDGVN